MNIHCIQHEAMEGLGAIESWALRRGHKISKTLLYANEKFPALSTFDWLIVMGGSMGTYDEDKYSWLKPEKDFLRAAIAAEKKILGVCLGSQLLAEALGGRVYSGEKKEIGWFPVELTDEGCSATVLSKLPRQFTPLHWHGDTFDLPSGVQTAATSAAYANQAFQSGRAVGLQFHLELTKQDLQNLSGTEDFSTLDGQFVQPLSTILAAEDCFIESARMLESVLLSMELI